MVQTRLYAAWLPSSYTCSSAVARVQTYPEHVETILIAHLQLESLIESGSQEKRLDLVHNIRHMPNCT
jgi:hypothetical protein